MFVFSIACGFVGGRLAPGTHLYPAVQTKFLQFSDKNDLHFALSLDYELSYIRCHPRELHPILSFIGNF